MFLRRMDVAHNKSAFVSLRSVLYKSWRFIMINASLSCRDNLSFHHSPTVQR